MGILNVRYASRVASGPAGDHDGSRDPHLPHKSDRAEVQQRLEKESEKCLKDEFPASFEHSYRTLVCVNFLLFFFFSENERSLLAFVSFLTLVSFLLLLFRPLPIYLCQFKLVLIHQIHLETHVRMFHAMLLKANQQCAQREDHPYQTAPLQDRLCHAQGDVYLVKKIL